MNVPKMENRRISKIRMDSSTVTIDYTSEREDGDRDTITISSHEKPKPEFRDAMKDMVPHVADIIGVTEEWMTDATVRSVSLKNKEGFLGAMISVIRPIDMSNCPLSFTTPLLFNDNIQHDGIGIYSDEMHDSLLDLMEQAYLYLDGNREPMKETTGNLFEVIKGQAEEGNGEISEPFDDADFVVDEDAETMA